MKKIYFFLAAMVISTIGFSQANPYPLVPIDSLTFVNAQKLGLGNSNSDYVDPVKKNPRYGDTVQVQGYVTFDPKSYGLSTTLARAGTFLQMNGTATPWGGVHVLMNKDIYPGDSLGGLETIIKFFANFQKGYLVKGTGIISEFNQSTQINLIKWETENQLTTTTITPYVTTVDQFMKNDGTGTQQIQQVTGEPWEGSYVELRNVTVVDMAPSGANRFFWTLQDLYGNKIKVRDMSGYFRNDGFDKDPNTPRVPPFAPPANGTFLSYVRGCITQELVSGVLEYFIAPLTPTDIGPVTFQPPVLTAKAHFPVIATSTDSVKLSCKITDDTLVASADMYYAVGYTNTTFIKVPMYSIGNSRWEAKVPPQVNGSIVKFWFRGFDNGGRFTNYPDTLASGFAYMVVNGGINSIAQLQFSPFPSGSSIWMGDTLTGINVRGVVTASAGPTDLGIVTLQSGTAPWSGIFIQPQTNDGVANWLRGDSIAINSCVVTEAFNVTTLTNAGNANSTKVSSGKPLPPFLMNINMDSIMAKAYNYTEPYEGMLVKFDNLYIVSNNPDAPSDFGEWSQYNDSSKTAGLRADDLSNDIGPNFNKDSFALKQKLAFLQGIMYYSFGNWKILPRDRNDIDRSGAPDHIAPVITLIGANPLTHPKGVAYTDPGATAWDNKDGNISTKIVVTNGVNINAIGTYIVAYNVKDTAGNAATEVRRTVNVVANGINEAKSNPINIYPNPSSGNITLEFEMASNGKAEVVVTDISGKIVFSEQHELFGGSNSLKLNTSSLSAGTYFVSLKTEAGTSVERFSIQK